MLLVPNKEIDTPANQLTNQPVCFVPKQKIDTHNVTHKPTNQPTNQPALMENHLRHEDPPRPPAMPVSQGGGCFMSLHAMDRWINSRGKILPPWFPWRSCQIQRRQLVHSTRPQLWEMFGHFKKKTCVFISSSFVEKQPLHSLMGISIPSPTTRSGMVSLGMPQKKV